MFCKNCGKEIADNAKFCEHCGAQLVEDENEDNSGGGCGSTGLGCLITFIIISFILTLIGDALIGLGSIL